MVSGGSLEDTWVSLEGVSGIPPGSLGGSQRRVPGQETPKPGTAAGTVALPCSALVSLQRLTLNPSLEPGWSRARHHRC